MSLIVKIATRADVPVEAVLRVLAREPVNADHKSRVLAILDRLDSEETRVLQRFALAAVHDELPRGGLARGDHEAAVAELVDDPLDLPEAVRLELGPGPLEEPGQEIEEAVFETAPVPQKAFDPAPLVQLGSVLGELTEAVRELRHETDAERRERVDDLAVLIDLITKGWEGVDRRLGRVERQLGRLESAPPQAIAPRLEPAPVPTPPEPPTPTPDGGDGDAAAAGLHPEDDGRSTFRQRLPLLVALALGVAIGAAAAIDLPSRLDASAVVGERTLTAEAAERAPLPRTVAQPPESQAPAKQPSRPPRQRTTAPPRTTSAPATTSARTAPARTAPARSTPTATSQPVTSQGAAPDPPQSDFTPSRNWAWPPTDGADYYLVEFFRNGKPLYRARPTDARVTLPSSVEFTSGTYRWRVRPGYGVPSAGNVGEAIVDSQFVLAG